MAESYRSNNAQGGAGPFTSPGVSGVPSRRPDFLKTDARGKSYVDYKSIEDLRRMLTPNGKIYSRKRLGLTARQQRMIAQAIKRARYMALLPYTDATL
jgi:small subunit ribosomal protein S18